MPDPIIPSAEPVVTPPVVETPPAVETPPVVETPPEPEAAPPAWALKRIDKLTKSKGEADERAIAAQAEADALRVRLAALEGSDNPPPAAGGLNEAEVERRAQAKAQQIAAANRFNDQCQSVYKNGTAAHQDFDTTMQGYVKIGGLPPQLVAAALEFDNPHELLYDLAKDLNEASRVIEMSPVQQAVALARLANKPKGNPMPISRAPEPIQPVIDSSHSAAVVDLNDKNLPMDKYAEERERQRALRKRRH